MRAADPPSLETMPVAAPSAPSGAAQARARFFNSGNAFNLKLPPVPAAIFPYDAGRAQARRESGFVPCDQSAALATPFAATTPLMLARYAFIAPDDALTADFAASGSIWYVIAGGGRATVAGDEQAAAANPHARRGTSGTFDFFAGETFETAAPAQPSGAAGDGRPENRRANAEFERNTYDAFDGSGDDGAQSRSSEAFEWSAGDVFVAPGGTPITLEAGAEGAVLWVVTNEPHLAFEGLRPPAPADRRIDVVHYPAGEIARQLARVVDAARDGSTAGIALIFSSERAEAGRNIMPSLTLSLNTVPAGEHQRAHRHNSAAVTLILGGSRCYSMVGERRCDWTPFATLVTPATEPHSHHNEGAERAAFLIVQDGGLHYHARTMGFTFLEPDA